MPRLSTKSPKYRLHRASGQAVVTIRGRDVYLGTWNTPESKDAYRRVIGEWHANGEIVAQTGIPSSLTLDEIILAFLSHAETYYVKNGRQTSMVYSVRSALRVVHELYGATTVAEFGPLRLKHVRQRMIESGLSFRTIAKHIGIVKRMFKWAAENEMIPVQCFQTLQTVSGLRRGRSQAKESRPVSPVPEEFVNAILPHVSRPVRAMIELQSITGMRPGEVVMMHGCDLETSGDIWIYTPASHKTEHHGKARVIYLGPKAQEIIRPFLQTNLAAYLFSPAASEADRRAEQHQQRRTPLSYGNRPGTNRKSEPNWKPRDRFDTGSYGRAIQRACDKAFPPPEDLARKKVKGKCGMRWETESEWKKRLGEDKWQELKNWQRSHRWSPNQLRHNAATNLRKQFGIEAARVVLGHSSAAVTEIYAELDQMKAADIMAKIG